MSAQTVEMQSDRLADQLGYFLDAVPDNADAWQLWRIRAEASFSLLNDDRVSGHVSKPFKPARLRIFASVPCGMSAPGLPATVTVPGLLGWRNWRPRAAVVAIRLLEQPEQVTDLR